MAEELSIEMPQQTRRQKFFHTWRGILVIILILLVILAGLLSWWLANGRISSTSATLDTLIYTVEPQFPSRLENVYVNPGDLVSAGQVLARIDPSTYSLHKSPNAASSTSGYGSRLEAARQAEKEMAARVNQARLHEEQLRAAWQERVTEHVRAQLAMRSLDVRHGNYPQAVQMEAAARGRMDIAKDEFEKYSRGRAALDRELTKIRAELRRNGVAPGNNSDTDKNASPQVDSDLYAPVTGRILRIGAVPGQSLKSGEPVFLILPTGKEKASDYWIQAWFPLEAKNSIKPGQAVNIKMGKNGIHLKGKVAAISDEAETLPPADFNVANAQALNPEERKRLNAQNYLPVRIILDQPNEAASFEPGTRVECQIQTRYVPGMGLFNL